MSEGTARILLVEDEDAIAQGLLLNFRRKGWAPCLASDGDEAIRLAADGVFDLVVLDIRLPTIDGFEVCQRLRAAGDLTPILMLTARNQPDDVVYGLRLGADDYVTKPFDLAELLARVEGLLRRRGWSRTHRDPTPESGGERFTFGEFWVDFGSWRAMTRQGEVELARKEIAVMRVFANRPGQVVSRRELLAEVWGLPDHPNTRVVDNVILSLRKAFEESSLRPRHIHNVRGVGYRFEV
ncbi:MAG: response regulator transcription factor [Thermoanaerobaculales bacterium]|jgi:two-component system alkaline phosphatase synthesis response regulator PhoP|nr:response regulator transcription factor [Thermoanaerobaculales bacterium]